MNSSTFDADRINEFWSWWAHNAAMVDEGINERNPGAFQDALDAHVSAIDEGLAWELVPGATARHRLTVTANGNPEVRPIAHRWLLAAPPADETWEYHSLRQAFPNVTSLVIGLDDGDSFELSHVRFGVEHNPTWNELDVAVYHPKFASLDASKKRTLILLALDNVIGERNTERWIGSIRMVTEEPENADTPEEFADRVQELNDNDSPNSWAALTGMTSDDQPQYLRLQLPLKPIDHPLLTEHGKITIPYDHHPETGLPTEQEQGRIDAIEDGVMSLESPALRVVTIETGVGVRTIGLYADPMSGIVDQVNAWTTDVGLPNFEWQHDPSWAAARETL